MARVPPTSSRTSTSSGTRTPVGERPRRAGPRRVGPRLAGVALVVAASAAFGSNPILARVAYAGGADVVAVQLARFVLAAPILLAVVRLRGEPLPRGRTLAGVVLMGGLYVGQTLAYYTALTLAPAALVALLLYLYPAIVTVLAVATLGERLTRPKVVALCLALVGAALTVVPSLGGSVGSVNGPAGGRPAGVALGVGLGLTTALLFAVYTLVGTRLTGRTGPLASSTVITATAAVVYAGVALARVAAASPPTPPATAVGWAAVGAITLLSTVLAIAALFAGLARLGPADTATVSTVEPVVTVVLAATVLGEPIGVWQAAGGASILAAVVVLARSRPALPVGPEAPPGHG